MALTGAQVRGKIKNIAKSNRADARILMRIYMMERFLERVANSPYSENLCNGLRILHKFLSSAHSNKLSTMFSCAGSDIYNTVFVLKRRIQHA